MKAIVTGGAGFIGSHLVDALIARGDSVVVIDDLSTGKLENVNRRAVFVRHDIRGKMDQNTKTVFKCFRGKIDYVFHLAALAQVPRSWAYPYETNEVNVDGTMNIIALAVWLNAKRLIYSSSSSVYGDQPTLPLRENMFVYPLSPYAGQKFLAEQYCSWLCQPERKNRLRSAVCLRYFNVYGPRQSADGPYPSVITQFIKARKDCVEAKIYGDGEQRRDFTHVSDVVRANILAAESQNVGEGEVINICAGKNYSVNQLSRMIGGSSKKFPPRDGDIRESLGDNTKARQLLGWEPKVPLEIGIAELLKLHKLL